MFLTRISDLGPGIPNLPEILEGRYRSSTGMGMGIIGSWRLMDQFRVEFPPEGGTSAWLSKILPRKAPLVDRRVASRISQEIARQAAQDPFGVIREQNQELLRALDELRKRQEELSRLNRELEDTNRGVVALYAELDEKADHLRRADDLKSRFLSNMSHEFRTPVNSIRALAQLLLERTDGELATEQERQIQFIQKAAEGLGELVDDLLDLAKVEAGKTVVHPVEFEVGNLFGALRGMLRPLLINESVSLVFEEPSGLPPLHSDEGKVSQILRNFISNALKFTPRGEVRVSARLSEDQKTVNFSVADTGIGIAAADQELIFKEFTQIPNPIQKRVKGTGLGLPLCRKLAELLGGSVSVHSEPGVGSTFTAAIPLINRTSALAAAAETAWETDPFRMPVLVVEDSHETVFIYEKFLNGSGFQLFHARNLKEAERLLTAVSPRAILLDIVLKGEDTWSFLARLKSDPATSSILVLHLSATSVQNHDRVEGLDAGADNYLVEPVPAEVVIASVNALLRIRRAEQAVRLAAQEWQTTFDGINDGICLTDRDGMVLRVNRALGDILGQRPEELPGKSWRDLLLAADGEAPEVIAHLLSTRSRETRELPLGARWFGVTVDQVPSSRGAVFILSEPGQGLESLPKGLHLQFFHPLNQVG